MTGAARTRLAGMASAARSAVAARIDRPSTPTPPSPLAVESVTAFLYREARLLDERRWQDWLALWTDDLAYGMPTRQSVLPADARRDVGAELTADLGAWWFDESRETLSIRIAKLETGKAWAEEPPSRTRRFVGNVEVEVDTDAGGAGGATVRSNALIHRGRRDRDVEWFSCARTDRLVATDAGIRIATRRVVIDTNVVPADNLILFF